uniref:G-protein coupled receptors family 1 profile domain-containing protein n=1 Tax=Plectus sambesii TaxID=2011161 RepID=A0A914WUX2_9BILA
MDVIDVLTLIAPYALLIVSFVSLFGNGTILLVVIKNASLRQKDCLYLIAALAVADFLTAVGTIPYSLNLLISSNTNCTAGTIFWTVAGNVSGVRMNQICTLCLAIDRLYALYRPFAYRAKNHLKIAQFVIAVSFIWSALEVVANVFIQDMSETKSSCTSGAGFSSAFRMYRMYSNLALNIGTQMLYAVVFRKIRKLKTEQSVQDAKDKLQQ